MKLNFIRKVFVLIIVSFFIGASIVPGISKNINKELNQNDDKKITPSNDIDWWPTFHHDLQRSGFSTSKAPNTNTVKWKYEPGGGFSDTSPVVVNDRLYIGTSAGKLYCIDANLGEKIWEFKAGKDYTRRCYSPSVADAKVFFLDNRGYLYCLDADNGSLIWSLFNDSWIDIQTSSPTPYNERLYFGTYNGKIYCLNMDDGEIIWKYKTSSGMISSPVILDGIVYFKSYHYLYCLDAYDGSYIWKFKIKLGMDSSPAFANGKVFVPDHGIIHCLNAENGSEIWNYSVAYSVSFSSPAIAYNNVYFSSKKSYATDGWVFCRNVTTGEKVWTYYTVDCYSTDSSPAVADGKVYIGMVSGYSSGPGGRILCLDAYNGELIWKYTPETNLGTVESSPVIANNKLYVCAKNNYIYCFEDPDETPPFINITKPGNAIYVKNRILFPYEHPVVFGRVDIEINAYDNDSGIKYVLLLLNNIQKANFTTEPYVWSWGNFSLKSHTITVKAFDNAGNNATDEIIVWKFF